MDNPILTDARRGVAQSNFIDPNLPYDIQFAQNELAKELKKVQTNIVSKARHET